MNWDDLILESLQDSYQKQGYFKASECIRKERENRKLISEAESILEENL